MAVVVDVQVTAAAAALGQAVAGEQHVGDRRALVTLQGQVGRLVGRPTDQFVGPNRGVVQVVVAVPILVVVATLVDLVVAVVVEVVAGLDDRRIDQSALVVAVARLAADDDAITKAQALLRQRAPAIAIDVGAAVPIVVGLVDFDTDGRCLDADCDERSAWKRLLGTLDDPYLWVEAMGATP